MNRLSHATNTKLYRYTGISTRLVESHMDWRPFIAAIDDEATGRTPWVPLGTWGDEVEERDYNEPLARALHWCYFNRRAPRPIDSSVRRYGDHVNLSVRYRWYSQSVLGGGHDHAILPPVVWQALTPTPKEFFSPAYGSIVEAVAILALALEQLRREVSIY